MKRKVNHYWKEVDFDLKWLFGCVENRLFNFLLKATDVPIKHQLSDSVNTAIQITYECMQSNTLLYK